MKKIHLLIGFAAMLLTNQAKALNEYITWTTFESYYATGYLPRVAIDQAYGAVNIFQDPTGFADLFNQTGNNQKAANPAGLGSTLWNFQQSVNGAIGHAGSIALARGNSKYDTAIEVHQGGQDGGAALWYTTATTKLSSTYELPAALTWGGSQEYDTGFNPTVAVDGSSFITHTNPTVELVVEAHQAASGSSNLWYHVGWLENPASASPTFVWGSSNEYDSGYAPSITIADGLVVEAHQGALGSLWYRLGTVAFFTINWSPAVMYTSGYNPSVSIAGCASCGGWTIVEAHQADSDTGPLMYRIGNIKSLSDTTITWTPKSDTAYATGCYPSIAQNASYIVEVHEKSCNTAANLIYSFGYFYFK